MTGCIYNSIDGGNKKIHLLTVLWGGGGGVGACNPKVSGGGGDTIRIDIKLTISVYIQTCSKNEINHVKFLGISAPEMHHNL